MPPSAEKGVPPAKPELEPGHSAPDHSEPALLGPGDAKPEAEDRCKWMWEDAGDYLGKLGKKLAQRANPARWTVGTPLAVAAKLEHETAKNPQKHSARKVLVKWLSPEQPERVLESPAAALAFMKPQTRQDCINTSPKDLMDPLTDLLPTYGMQLHAVATRGDVAEGARLVEAVGPRGHLDLLAAVDVHGRIPLHCAASSGHETMCALLLGHEATAQLEAADHIGETPLHRAAAGVHEAVCTLLAARGSDRRWVPWGGIFRGMTAAALAECKGHAKLAQLLSPRLTVTTGRWWFLRQARRDSSALCEELAEHIAELAAEQSWRAGQPVGEHGEQERSCRRPQQLHAVKQSYAEAFAREFRARPRSVSRPQDTGPGRAIQADASGRLGLEQEQRDIHMAVEASLMSASKHSVQADEDLAARNMSIYGNPFGPREVDPLEMQVSRRGTVGPSMRTAPLPPHAAPHACSRGAESGGFYS
jgi:hypothetical protein